MGEREARTTSGRPTVAEVIHSDETLYRSVLRSGETTRKRLTDVTGMSLAEVDRALEKFVESGLLRVVDDRVIAVPPGQVVGEAIAAESDRLRSESARLDALRNMLPALVADHAVARSEAGSGVAVHAVEGGDIVALLRSLAEESTGDLLWLRPDQWRFPTGREADALTSELVAQGRTSRAIYPVRVLEEAPQLLRRRAEAGEMVRVVASVPARISIFGSSAALVPDRWGQNTGRRLVVREHSLVGALTALFEHAWERGMTVPGLEPGVVDQAGERRLLLLQLTRGAKDEQIARALGVSLRTVRRRIADLMAELGADSRFQAGVEAVRRGWV